MKDNKDKLENEYKDNKKRKIEFRAKATNRDENREYRTNYKNGDWVYGLITDMKNYYGYAQMVNSDGVSGIDVDPDTVGQFTSIVDINGNKIYEGDILRMKFSNEYTNNEEREVYYSVKFTDGMFATFYKDYENGQWEDVEDSRLDKALIEVDKLEVVGNIYDNPELLGGSDEECDN